jgi:hypothetical protein
MPRPESRHSALLLPTGSVLIVGIYGVHVYDPVAEAWQNIPPHSPFFLGTATLLPSGRVLLSGEFYLLERAESSALYDPITESWTTTGSMTTPRAFHSATLLPDGSVLVAGGRDDNGYLDSAERFSPDGGQ